MKHKNEKTRIVQQSYNIRTTKKNNEKRKWNTPIKHNNEDKHWNTAMTNNKLKQWKQQWNTKVKKQQSYNNQKPMKHTNETQWNTTMKNYI